MVNCVLTPDTKQKLTLTYSNTLNDLYYEKITDATVSLFEEGELAGKFEKDYYGDWELNYMPVSGKRYKLNIEIIGHATLEAETTMPFNIPVSKDKDREADETFVRKYFVQDSCKVPYWIFVMGKYDKTEVITSKDKLFNSLGTNHVACDRFNLSGLGMSSLIGQDAKTMEQQVYLRVMPDENEVYQFCVETQADDYWIFFRAASKEYDRYLKTSFQKMLIYQAFDDPSQWFDESVVYSNITNGLGIFGACSDMIFKYKLDSWEPPLP